MTREPLEPELYALAFDLSLRALSQQERAVNELRGRTATLLAASSVAASVLGARAAVAAGSSAIAVAGMAAFALSVVASLFTLLPRPSLVFALSGSVLLREELRAPGGLPEAHHRLAAWLETFHDANQQIVNRLAVAFGVAALAVLLEIVLWATQLLSG